MEILAVFVYFLVGTVIAILGIRSYPDYTRIDKIASAICFPIVAFLWPFFLFFRIVNGKW
jgi:hypothetical protein